MAQDYAKRAAQHKQQMSKNKPSPISKAMLTVTLVVVVSFVGFLYFLTQVNPAPSNADKNKRRSPVKEQTVNDKATAKQAPLVEQSQPENKYDFYKLLPESEVIPPQVEEYKSTPIQEGQQKSFILQAGSFRNYDDADRLRAKLILEGLEVNVQLVKNGGGSRWHRVLVGPFTSRSRLNHAQDILARANTESMVMEVKE